jgi:uncharacterized protein (DUF4415 family)
MKEEYDLTKLKRRPGPTKYDREAAKIQVNIRLDGCVVAWFKDEAERSGIPYQTLIGSVLHRFAVGEIKDVGKTPSLKETTKKTAKNKKKAPSEKETA